MLQSRPAGRTRTSLATFVSACALAAVALVPLAPTRADEFTDRLNRLVNDPDHPVSADVRSENVILPVLAGMEDPPAVLRTQQRAALLGSDGPGWAECAAWAQKPAQKAVLEVLEKVTKEEDRLKSDVFAQPYGVAALGADPKSIDLIQKGMYTELGEPPLISAARHLYLPAMENAGILVQVEASRRFGASDAPGALKVLRDWMFFAREMADRPLLEEKKWGMETMLLCTERARDIIYQDFQSSKPSIDATALRKINDALKERRGFLQIEKIRLPEGDFIGREQLINLVMDSDGKPSETTFAPLMARASASQRPLRLFSAAAYWDQARLSHADKKDTLKMLSNIRGDWEKRWQLSPFDTLSNTTTDYRKYVQTTTKYAVLNEAFNDMDSLFTLRQQLKAEIGATRMCIGVYAYYVRNKQLPVGLAACRPEFIDFIDKDPYSRANQDLHYFVPMRDTPSGQPWTINLYPPAPNPEFKRDLNEHNFVIYSVGPDGASNRAEYATQTRTGVRGDYLLFPPTVSLYRQRLLEKGELK